MSVQSFDIDAFLRFAPPKRLCKKCYGLHLDMPVDSGATKLTCRVCGVEYLATDYCSVWGAQAYFEEVGLSIEFQDAIKHCQTLATIAGRVRKFLASPHATDDPYPPMRALFDALQASQKFVHFTTYGISPMLVGALKMTGLRVPVRGVISNVDANMVEDFAKYGNESPLLEVKLFERSINPAMWESMPHQKIVVVDGLLAFKGSANLTVNGWRKSAQGLDLIEVVTDVKEVVDLHNRLFSPLWAGFSTVSQIPMVVVPF